MADRDTIRQALADAVGWQLGLADAWPEGSPERAEALALVKAYRALLKKRYGDERLPDERALAGTRKVGLDELRKMAADAVNTVSTQDSKP